MLDIDGSTGGGQILRTALGLSVVTGKGFVMEDIRGSRDNPGLKAQHLEGVKAITDLCNAETEGVKMGSTRIEFIPGDIRKTELDVEIDTAGSVGLVFQTLQLVPWVLEDPLTVRVKGGATYGKWAPPVDYLNAVFLPVMEKGEYSAEMEIDKHGFYPKGGAHTEFTIHPWEGDSINLTERGELHGISILSIASTHLRDAEVADRQANAASKLLRKRGYEVDIDVSYVEADNPGSGIICYADHENTVLGGDSVGEKGVRAEKVGRKAAEDLLESLERDATVDRYTGDMILPFLGLAAGEVTVPEMTDHIRTNMDTIHLFLDIDMEIEGRTIRRRNPHRR